MAKHRSDAFVAELRRMRREVWAALARPRRQHRWRDAAAVEPEAVTAAAHFVKVLAARAADVQLLGEVELLQMEMADIVDAQRDGKDISVAVAAVEGRESKVRSRRYSSVEVIAVFGQLGVRYPRASYLLDDDWLTNAAMFVKRLAVAARDGDAVLAAEMVVQDEERRRRERDDAILREEERERLEAEAAEQQQWDEYESVSNAMLGRRLKPPVDSRAVIKLLNIAGLTVKNEKTWVFTKAGLEYIKFEAPEGSKVPWAAWSKAVLPVLQATLDAESANSSS
jgi:hypothetical protein